MAIVVVIDDLFWVFSVYVMPKFWMMSLSGQ